MDLPSLSVMWTAAEFSVTATWGSLEERKMKRLSVTSKTMSSIIETLVQGVSVTSSSMESGS